MHRPHVEIKYVMCTTACNLQMQWPRAAIHALPGGTGLSNHDPPKMKCVPPGADERLAMFGNLHGFSHAISASSSRAQQLYDQARLQLRKQLSP